MRKLLLSALGIAWLYPLVSSAAEPDAALQRRLVGQWEETRRIDCEVHHQRMTLEANGTFVVHDKVEGCRKRSFSWRGTWSIASAKFRYAVTETTSPEDIAVGAQFEDAIVSVTDTSWVMMEESTGGKSVATRATSRSGQAIAGADS